MGHAVTQLVHPYGLRIDGERECKSGARAEHVQKSDSRYVDLDFDSLANLLAKPVGEGVGNIMGHAVTWLVHPYGFRLMGNTKANPVRAQNASKNQTAGMSTLISIVWLIYWSTWLVRAWGTSWDMHR